MDSDRKEENDMELNLVFGNAAAMLTLLGVLACMVIIITEMIKDLRWVKNTPTKLVALAVSFVVTMGALLLYLEIREEAFVWWYLAAAFFAAFIVGYVSINGWDTLYEIWERLVEGRGKGRKE